MRKCFDCALPMSAEFVCPCETPHIAHDAIAWRFHEDGSESEEIVPCDCANLGHVGLCCDCFDELHGLPPECRKRART